MQFKKMEEMKKLTKIIIEHANKHQELLKQNWKSTELSKKQKDQILKRIDKVLDQLPEAVTQAHERIIGERQVASKNKILSLYESEINVIVRGKAGAEVEFGNTLMIAEQAEGVQRMVSKLKNENFVELQTRRSQTEGRISILKNKFFGNP